MRARARARMCECARAMSHVRRARACVPCVYVRACVCDRQARVARVARACVWDAVPRQTVYVCARRV